LLTRKEVNNSTKEQEKKEVMTPSNVMSRRTAASRPTHQHGICLRLEKKEGNLMKNNNSGNYSFLLASQPTFLAIHLLIQCSSVLKLALVLSLSAIPSVGHSESGSG
jgi:hypothetical protein